MDVDQNLQGLSHEVCSTKTAIIVSHSDYLLELVLGISATIHQQLGSMLRGFIRLKYIQINPDQ